VVAYEFLPVASVPNVDFPSIRVNATRPGADPGNGATVAAPLERRLGEIAGISQITSTSRSARPASSCNSPSVAISTVPRAMCSRDQRLARRPADRSADIAQFRKANTAAAPVFVLALTSKTIPSSALYDVATP